MRRSPVVLTGTAIGLWALLSFRSTPQAVSLVGTTSAPPTTTTLPARATTTVAGAGGGTPTTMAPPVTTTTVAAGARSATGPVVNYFYGTMSVKVDVSGAKITKVSIASLNDGGNPRSMYIDQQAIPMLIQEVMSVQSSKIQGISGATYTSEGFYTSLLAALKTLGHP
jgi:uncharacterized protein with FMN-binding domain